MSWSYSCPHCSAGLNPDDTIILIGECEEVRTLLGLHPMPGNYKVYLPPAVELVPGKRWQISCPVCQQNLVTEVSDGLCAVDGTITGSPHRVYFSPVAGEHATFVVSAEGLIERHGADAEKHSLDLLQLI